MVITGHWSIISARYLKYIGTEFIYGEKIYLLALGDFELARSLCDCVKCTIPVATKQVEVPESRPVPP